MITNVISQIHYLRIITPTTKQNPITVQNRGIDVEIINQQTKQNLSYYVSSPEKNTSNKVNKQITCWTLDSGTSYHMRNQLENLHNIKECYKVIEFANGGNVIATHIGTYVGFVNKNKTTLKNVLYISVFKRSSMSIDNLSENRYKMVFYRYNNKNLASVYGPDRNKLFTTSSNSSRVYKIWTFKSILRFSKNKKENNIKCDNIILSLNDENFDL